MEKVSSQRFHDAWLSRGSSWFWEESCSLNLKVVKQLQRDRTRAGQSLWSVLKSPVSDQHAIEKAMCCRLAENPGGPLHLDPIC